MAMRAMPRLINLEVLNIGDEYNNLGTQKRLLDALTTPVLRRLAVSEYEIGRADSVSTIASLLSRSQCHLKTLRVHRSLRTETDYRAAFPSVISIKVHVHAASL